MNKQEFLNILEKGLRQLNASEKDDVLRYYDEFISDMEDQEKGISELGDPRQLSAEILRDSLIHGAIKTDSAAKKGISSIVIVFLSIIAAPFGLILSVLLFVLAFTSVFLISSFILIFYLFSVIMVLAGMILFVATLLSLPIHLLSSVSFFGASLFFLGIGVLCFIATSNLINFITKKVVSRFSKGKKLKGETAE